MAKTKDKWSWAPQSGTYDVEWTHKGKRYRSRIAAGCEGAAAKHGRQICHPGAYATIEVHFRGQEACKS